MDNLNVSTLLAVLISKAGGEIRITRSEYKQLDDDGMIPRIDKEDGGDTIVLSLGKFNAFYFSNVAEQ